MYSFTGQSQYGRVLRSFLFFVALVGRKERRHSSGKHKNDLTFDRLASNRRRYREL